MDTAVIGIEQEQSGFQWPEWLDQKDAARYLGISPAQVCLYMKNPSPPWPFYRVTATKKLSKRADLDAWLEKVKVSAEVPK